jgi:hypothetical protein
MARLKNRHMKTTYEVEVSNIYIDDRYYSFDYKVWKNSVPISSGSYDSDHSWGADNEEFLEELKNGYADQIALEQTNL